MIENKFIKDPDGTGESCVLVLAAEYLKEGVSFYGVREVILAGLSNRTAEPYYWSIVSQQLARAIRLCSHKFRDDRDPTKYNDNVKDHIHFFLFLATIMEEDVMEAFPEKNADKRKMISELLTRDEEKYLELLGNKKETEDRERELSSLSIDSIFYKSN